MANDWPAIDQRGIRWMRRPELTAHAFRVRLGGDPHIALCGALPHPKDEDCSRRSGRVCVPCSVRWKKLPKAEVDTMRHVQ